MFDDFRLKDSQILANLLDVCSKENVEYTEDGLEAVIFTAQVIKTTFRCYLLDRVALKSRVGGRFSLIGSVSFPKHYLKSR